MVAVMGMEARAGDQMARRTEGAPERIPAGEAAQHDRVHIPEPMMFDLVRELGARRGETEANVLAQFPLDHQDSRAIEWAPEIERAIFDNVALELELPFMDGTLEAYKAAAQVTFGRANGPRFIHGSQLIVEKVRGKDQVELSALYIPGFRFNERWSTLWLIGVQSDFGDDRKHDPTFLVNASVCLETGSHTTFGIEANYSHAGHSSDKLLLMPQAHYEPARHWSIQFGLGAEFREEKTNGTSALRVITTF